MVTNRRLITKESLSELANGKRYDYVDELPIEWIGQGYGYKSNMAFGLGGNYICYIPEYCYDEESKELNLDSCYTKSDFVKLAGSEEKAKELFDAVDWQHPSTLWDEWNEEE